MAGKFSDETERVAIGEHARKILGVDLVVVSGPSRGKRHTIEGGAAKVGAAPGNDLQLEDPTVSRVHCALSVSDRGVTLRDLGSTNGTFVGDDIRIKEAELLPGLIVRAGASSFRIEAAGAPAFVPLSDRSELGELVGASVEMRGVYAILERAAPATTTLLLQGETGTGKDVAARTVHALSPRRAGPFVPVDCGAIPESLIESELFGHVRGAFTGAVSNRVGAFEEASGGTLFLDEIGEMPLAVQAKLLRALESKTVRRVGESRPIPVDVRIIAATNRSLAHCVNDGTFREDLYYRLAVVDVVLPPLRARRGDIPALAARLFERIAPGAEPLPSAFVAALQARSWPGNVRELRNFIERAYTLGQIAHSAPSTREPYNLPAGIESAMPLHLPLKDARDLWTLAFERSYVRSALEKADGNLTRAAETAGVSRRFLQRMIVRLGLRALSKDDLDDDGD